MDIANIDESRVESGAVLTLKHPATGDPTKIKIRLASTHSNAYRRKILEMGRRAYETGEKIDPNDTEANRERGAVAMAAVTLGWEGMTENGKPVKFSTKTAERVYRQYRWIYDQVDKFIANDQNFFIESPNN